MSATAKGGAVASEDRCSVPTSGDDPELDIDLELSRLTPLSLLLLIGGGVLLLATSGDGALEAPPTDLRGFQTWISEGHPIAHLAALSRLALLGLGSWWLLTLSAGALARIFGADRIVGVVDRLSPRGARVSLRNVGALALVSALSASASGASQIDRAGPAATSDTSDGPSVPPATMRWVPAGVGSSSGGSPTTGRPSNEVPPTSHPPSTQLPSTQLPTAQLPTAQLPTAQLPTAQPLADQTQALGPRAAPSGNPEPRALRTVKSGEHLWSIASDVTASRLGHRPSAGEIADYWMELIDANRNRLADPTNPDLIHPGLVLVLP